MIDVHCTDNRQIIVSYFQVFLNSIPDKSSNVINIALYLISP